MDNDIIPFVSGGVDAYELQSERNHVSSCSNGNGLQIQENELAIRSVQRYSFGGTDFRSIYPYADIEEGKWEKLWRVLMRLCRRK